MGRPEWADLAAETRETVSELYAERARQLMQGSTEGVGRAHDAQLRTGLDEAVDEDPELSFLVAEESASLPDDDRAVLALPGRLAEPVRWGCPDPGCRKAPVAGDRSRPYGSRTCAAHPTTQLRRLS
jgi:hypothetical protein